MQIKDSIVLITGANRGIGKAYVEEFMKAGAKKIYLGVRDLDSVKDLAASNPETLIPLELDVTNPEHIKAAAEKAFDLTILVNNAGIAKMGGLEDSPDINDARLEMEVNYFGPLHLTKMFAPILRENGGGQIVNVSSIGGLVVFPGAPTYCSSKAAAHFLTIASRMELSHQGVNVLGVYPGPVDTDMAKDIQMEKVSPNHIALQTINAIEEGKEDLLPDPYAQETYELFLKDPKLAENRMREAYEQMAQAA